MIAKGFIMLQSDLHTSNIPDKKERGIMAYTE